MKQAARTTSPDKNGTEPPPLAGLGQEVGRGNLADRFAVQHQRNPVARPEHLACFVEGSIAVSSGLRENLDLPFGEIPESDARSSTSLPVGRLRLEVAGRPRRGR